MTEPLQTRLDDCSRELTRLRLLLGVELSIEPLVKLIDFMVIAPSALKLPYR